MSSCLPEQIDPLFFYSLTKANLESDRSLSSSSIVLTSDSGEFFVPFTYRSKVGKIKTKNLGNWILDQWPGNDWFWVLETANYSELYERIENNTDLVITADDGYWTAPYIDCKLTSTWHVTYGVPFFTRTLDELYFK
ncbi:uncharacterized protein CDAR_391841 [Caerostris darwini]|uniref:Uncharacterized protein n=1 Tax=Caerostris darwini TaxID=1538125 RepID=A0AAV4S117_9ARAC|nr:uncharacterized protein CDAR_391841 [Caerostris darwini]